MDKNTPKGKVNLFKNDKITLVRSTGKQMRGTITELSDRTFWVKYKNPERWGPDSKIGDVVNMVLHYENFDIPFSAKIIQRFNPGDIAVDVCYEAGEDVLLVQRHEQYRRTAQFPVYIRKILHMHDHSEYVMDSKNIPVKDKNILDNYNLCKSLNISGSGIRIQTEMDLEKGTTLECIFSLDGHDIVAVGIVQSKQQRRSSVHEYGIYFEKIHPSNVKRIIKYVYKEDTVEKKLPNRSLFGRKRQG